MAWWSDAMAEGQAAVANMAANMPSINMSGQLSHLSGGFGGDGTIGTFTPKTTTPTTTTADTTKAVQDSIAASKGFFDDLPDWSYYEPKSEEDFTRLSSQFRDIYEMPQRQSLERRLEQALADALSQEDRIRSNYVAQENMFGEREREQGRLDLESAIARGGGRSGVVPYMSQQRDQYYTGQLAGMSAQRMAELNAIANQLGLVQRQVPVELQQLAEQASRLEAQELQRLMDLDYARGQEHDMDQFNRMLQVFDRTKLTRLEQGQLHLQAAEIAGMFPKSAPDIYGMVGLPQTTAQTTATTAGKFNPTGLPGTLTIKGREYSAANLAGMY